MPGKGPRKGLDRYDQLILYHMQVNAFIANEELARKIQLSPAACSRRTRRLQELGYINPHNAMVLNPKALGFSLSAFVQVVLEIGRRRDIEKVGQDLQQIEGVVDLHLLSGDVDYLVKVVAMDMQDLHDIFVEISSLAGVAQFRSMLILEHIECETKLPLRKMWNDMEVEPSAAKRRTRKPEK